MIPLTIDKQREPKKGDILLSEPFLMDDHFTRSVIYLCEHNDEGSFGFILNNTLDLKLNEFAEGFPSFEATVGFGGPVDRNQLFFLHSISELKGAIPIQDSIFLGGSYAELLRMLNDGEAEASDIRFFIGYTGWAAEQLGEELSQKTWIVLAPPSSTMIMRPSDDTLWKDMVQSLGGKYKRMADYPINPADN